MVSAAQHSEGGEGMSDLKVDDKVLVHGVVTSRHDLPLRYGVSFRNMKWALLTYPEDVQPAEAPQQHGRLTVDQKWLLDAANQVVKELGKQEHVDSDTFRWLCNAIGCVEREEKRALAASPAETLLPECSCEEDRCFGPVTGYTCRASKPDETLSAKMPKPQCCCNVSWLDLDQTVCPIHGPKVQPKCSGQTLIIRCRDCSGSLMYEETSEGYEVIHSCKDGKQVREMFEHWNASRAALIAEIEGLITRWAIGRECLGGVLCERCKERQCRIDELSAILAKARKA